MNVKWKYLFFVAAGWNIIASLKALVNIKDNAHNFYLESTTNISPILISNLYVFWWTVLSFGIGYILVGLNPSKNHALVLIAMLGKLFVGVIWIRGFQSGIVNQLGLMGGVGDILFAIVFGVFLFKAHKIKANE